MSAVIVTKQDDGEQITIGPFSSGELASRWGFRNLSGQEWHWVDLFDPNNVEQQIMDNAAKRILVSRIAARGEVNGLDL